MQNADHRPGILVGICSKHFHGHQDGLVGTDVKGKIFVFEFFHALHFTEMNLDKSQLVSAPSFLLKMAQYSCWAFPGDKLTLTTQAK